MDSARIAIVIPCLNEAGNIPELYRRLGLELEGRACEKRRQRTLQKRRMRLWNAAWPAGEKAWRAAKCALVQLVAYYSCVTFLRVQHWKTTETTKEDVMQQNHNNIETTNNKTHRK